jgi:hypothetical protein
LRTGFADLTSPASMSTSTSSRWFAFSADRGFAPWELQTTIRQFLLSLVRISLLALPPGPLFRAISGFGLAFAFSAGSGESVGVGSADSGGDFGSPLALSIQLEAVLLSLDLISTSAMICMLIQDSLAMICLESRVW